jgi:hypothetical protein
MKKEQKIKEAATLARAQKQNLMASSISQIKGKDIDQGSSPKGGDNLLESSIGQKRKTREDEEIE